MYQECRHIKTSGTKCGAPALKDKAYCYFHFRAHQFRHRQPGDRIEAFMKPTFKVALLEDRGAIQAAISETIHALAQDHMDHKRAGRILWGLHLAIANLKVPEEIVATEPVRAIFHNEEGEEIGPEEIRYDEQDKLPQNDGNDGLELAENGTDELAKAESDGHPKSAIVKAEESRMQSEESDTRETGNRAPDQNAILAISKPSESLRETIRSFTADLQRYCPELAAQPIIKKMKMHLNLIP